MEIKFGDMTIEQIRKICSQVDDCIDCPLCCVESPSRIGCILKVDAPVDFPVSTVVRYKESD